jgi:hypothetical protein
MNDLQSGDLEELIRAAGATSRNSCGLRERTIAKAVAARSQADRESRLGPVLSAAALTVLLAMTIWKHTPLAGVAPAICGVRPAVIRWETPDGGETGSNASPALQNESREWKQVKHTARRQRKVALILARCFGS